MSEFSSTVEAQAQLILAAEELVKKHMAAYDPSHDWYHVDRVRRTALALGKSLPKDQPCDMLVLELAALFHDLTDAKYATTPISTSTLLSPFFSTPLALSVFGFSLSSTSALICRIVDNVSWSKETKLRANGEWEDGWRETCWELGCVQDGDRLDAIGGMGIMRCCAYSASVNRALYIPLGGAGQNETAIQHFEDKLFKISGNAMKTPLGRQLAEKRQALMRAFVDGVEEEYALLDTI
ncbi:hypothetical protein BDY24DRAFT_415002 [Mrakia frigida]|uniref:HD domain-containing protein n=1 Tax=Mrakia frigida TaxID=29902 RepID=UPI003FCC21D7